MTISKYQFLEQKKDIGRSSALYSIGGPFELVHADVANIRGFFSKSAVNPSYCLLCVDLFSSKVYVYPMKKMYFLVKNLEFFFEEIEPKRNINEQMRLKTDLEFQQREILKLNEKYYVLMFSTKLRGAKSFAAGQKIREFKNYS